MTWVVLPVLVPYTRIAQFRLQLEFEEVKRMEYEPGYTPLAHQEECDCCCGCDSFAERDDYPKDEEGNPIYRPL